MGQLLLSLPLLYLGMNATLLAIRAPTSHHSLSHSGELTSYAILCAFLTASKSHSLVSLITGLSFDKIIKFHMASALLSVWMACLHCIQIAYLHRGDNTTHDHQQQHVDEQGENKNEDASEHHEHDPDHFHEHESEDAGHEGHYHHHRILHTDSIHAYLGPDPNLWKFFWDGNRNQSGFIVLTSLVVLVSTSLFAGVLRQKWFEGWLATHIAGVVLVLVYGLVHGADIFVFALIWWALDWFIRYGFMARMRYPKQAQIIRVCDDVTQITFPNVIQFQPGQFVQIAIPTVKPLQFHPFSIASIPEDDNVSLYVRALPGADTWTRQLHDIVTPRQDGQKISMLNVRMLVEGPYGSVPAILGNGQKYSMAVLISGGIGVTPCHSVGRSLVTNPPPGLHKLWFVWSVRDEAVAKAIPPPTRVDNFAQNEKHADDENGIELVEQSPGIAPNVSNGHPNDQGADHNDSLVDSTGAAGHSLELQTDIYVTQLSSKSLGNDSDEYDNTEGSSFGYNVCHGQRPDVHAILKQIQTEAVREGWARVFVMGSGPPSMLNELQVACKNSQLQNLQIDYEQEVFGYS
jgi:hypothetical protein